MTVNVLVADDHPILLQGLSDLIKSAGRFAVAEATTSGHRALAQIRRSPPDIAVLDLAMPGIGGMDILRTIYDHNLPVRAIFLSASISAPEIRAALGYGVWGLVLKDHATDDLLNCLSEVADGRKWLPPPLVAKAGEDGTAGTAHLLSTLTQRETEIAQLVARGLSNRAIAEAVGSAEGTVSIHLHNIYRKLDIGSRTMLAALLIKEQG